MSWTNNKGTNSLIVAMRCMKDSVFFEGIGDTLAFYL